MLVVWESSQSPVGRVRSRWLLTLEEAYNRYMLTVANFSPGKAQSIGTVLPAYAPHVSSNTGKNSSSGRPFPATAAIVGGVHETGIRARCGP